MQLLRKVHDELLSQLAPPKSVDPLTMLPRELAEMMLEYLTFQQRMNACLVSNQWALFIRSAPSLWQHLDLSAAKRKVRSSFVSRAINIGREKLTTATLSMLQDFDKALAALIRNCPLQELSLLETGLQSRNLVEALECAKDLKTLRLSQVPGIGPTALAQLLKTSSLRLEALECTLVKSERFGGVQTLCDNLKILNVSVINSRATRALAPTVFASLAKFTPNLHSLTLRNLEHVPLSPNTAVDLSRMEHLKCLDIELPLSAAYNLRLPPFLTSLRLVPMSRTANFFLGNVNFGYNIAGQSATNFRLPHLQDLTTDIAAIHISQLRHLLTNESEDDVSSDSHDQSVTPSNLQRLSVQSSMVTVDDLNALFVHPRLRGLSQLTLQPEGSCDDSHVHVIAEKLPEVHTINLSGTEITGVGVKDLVDRGQVRHLVLNDCRLLGRDAVDWARAQGVRVDYRMGGGANTGKKVRY